jgi:stearoyl-CoA desaturase (Delta-9 desaturase)
LEIVWQNVLIFVFLHASAIYGYTLEKTLYSSYVTGWVVGFIAGFGTTAGAHRLYTHRTYKANAKLRFLLVLFQTIAVQNSMYEWVRDHRVHHKYTDTNADPHNSRRGFFFSHIGWLMCKKHPDVKKFGGRIDMSDLEADPIVMFQHKYYLPLALIFGFVLPVWFVCYLGESFVVVWNGHLLRYMIGLHIVWMVNSVAHIWGSKPYEKAISPTENYIVGIAALGEGEPKVLVMLQRFTFSCFSGWHNYHVRQMNDSFDFIISYFYFLVCTAYFSMVRL